jgi:hypothetical protein
MFLQTKYKQSKTEGNSAQNNLQKEITSLRDTNRTLQLKLRDIEVANDDYERQARNTTSSLEDMEYKHNSAIERGVLLEEEMREGEQERESLRIQNQRLRDELTDLKVEAEIVQEKLRNAEGGHAFRLCNSSSQIITGFLYRHSSLASHLRVVVQPAPIDQRNTHLPSPASSRCRPDYFADAAQCSQYSHAASSRPFSNLLSGLQQPRPFHSFNLFPQ